MTMDLTHDDVEKILRIIEEAKHLEEFDFVHGEFRLHIRRSASGVGIEREPLKPAPSPSPTPAPAKAGPAPVPEGMVAVRAPMLGTFYRAPSPAEPPFVEVGQAVGSDDTLCLIEVMKLFSAIKAGVEGRVAEIRAQNGQLVEYDEIVIVIDPARK
jgi:acetyl-CoA carboxylase biotin carboxyl carrier protein